ncbi:[Protein-PII] uridylyltransferase / [Protein-PII]-UMP uridylyl-removing enzyme, partial [hydrothermal vent metagenome]
NLVLLFKLAGDNNLDLHPDAFQLANRSLRLIGRDMRRDKRANAIFLDILTNSERPVFLLRKMNECGVLGRFIPAFRRIVAMMQFNMYHHFTVDEHLLRTVGTLAKINNGKLADEHPMSHALLPDIKDKVPLYVAAFLHDIAKGRKEDHSIAGAKIARKLCPRLGLSKSQTEMVSWLILEHLTMSNTAQSRDLSDRKTIENFAAKVQTMDRLRHLLILTVCDTRAVGPGVWNGWKGQLLRTLYEETEPLLTGGFSHRDRSARVEEAKHILANKLPHWPAEQISRVLALPYVTYFLSTDPDAQPRHMQFIANADEAKSIFAFDIHAKEFEGITEISILAPDHPHLLSTIAGVCASANANIAGAQIHTLRDGRAFDTILINREFEGNEDEMRRANSIGAMIGEMLSGTSKQRPESSASKSLHSRQSAFDVESKVMIDNGLSNKFSVIEVEGLDRHGLLADLAQELSSLNLDIGSAHIVTFGEKAVDTFYVTDLTGLKITDGPRKQKISAALLKILDAKANHDKVAA